jgi:hypothetical protein
MAPVCKAKSGWAPNGKWPERSRPKQASSPKLQVFNNALMGCHWVAQGVGLQAAQARPNV